MLTPETTAPEKLDPAAPADSPSAGTPVRIHVISHRAKPRVGDRRTTKKYGLQIRVWRVSSVFEGALLLRGGRPVFEWREPQYLSPGDRHLLTHEEMEHHFPSERLGGYMQQRGAA